VVVKIVCVTCHYECRMRTDDGRCPKCGAYMVLSIQSETQTRYIPEVR